MQTPDSPSEKITRLITSGMPLLYVATWEEERLERMLATASEAQFGEGLDAWMTLQFLPRLAVARLPGFARYPRRFVRPKKPFHP